MRARTRAQQTRKHIPQVYEHAYEAAGEAVKVAQVCIVGGPLSTQSTLSTPGYRVYPEFPTAVGVQ
jgi:hypothetical protein